jgi:hypothetical protein
MTRRTTGTEYRGPRGAAGEPTRIHEARQAPVHLAQEYFQALVVAGDAAQARGETTIDVAAVLVQVAQEQQ